MHCSDLGHSEAHAKEFQAVSCPAGRPHRKPPNNSRRLSVVGWADLHCEVIHWEKTSCLSQSAYQCFEAWKHPPNPEVSGGDITVWCIFTSLPIPGFEGNASWVNLGSAAIRCPSNISQQKIDECLVEPIGPIDIGKSTSSRHEKECEIWQHLNMADLKMLTKRKVKVKPTQSWCDWNQLKLMAGMLSSFKCAKITGCGENCEAHYWGKPNYRVLHTEFPKFKNGHLWIAGLGKTSFWVLREASFQRRQCMVEWSELQCQLGDKFECNRCTMPAVYLYGPHSQLLPPLPNV